MIVDIKVRGEIHVRGGGEGREMELEISKDDHTDGVHCKIHVLMHTWNSVYVVEATKFGRICRNGFQNICHGC